MIGVNKTVQYEARQSIVAGSNVTTGTQGDVIIKDNSNITFTTGESIVLKPGFSVKAGSSFHAYIKDFTCSATSQTNMMARSAGYKNNSENTNNESNNKLPKNQSPSVTDILKPDRIKITPNPTNGEFEVSIDQPGSKSVTIQVFSFYFGSSLSSENKNKIIERMGK
ncbi:MAG: 3-coathanger stack domain-containing protein [Paludibacter sp.]